MKFSFFDIFFSVRQCFDIITSRQTLITKASLSVFLSPREPPKGLAANGLPSPLLTAEPVSNCPRGGLSVPVEGRKWKQNDGGPTSPGGPWSVGPA